METKTLKCKGHPAVRHVDCGGQIAIGGEGYRQLPIGFGGSESGKFVIDVIRYPTYSGFCLKCKAEGDFIRIDKEPTTKRIVPRGINRKIKNAMLMPR